MFEHLVCVDYDFYFTCGCEEYEVFNLSNNQLSGVLPGNICRLNCSISISFDNNQFCEPYPECPCTTILGNYSPWDADDWVEEGIIGCQVCNGVENDTCTELSDQYYDLECIDEIGCCQTKLWEGPSATGEWVLIDNDESRCNELYQCFWHITDAACYSNNTEFWEQGNNCAMETNTINLSGNIINPSEFFTCAQDWDYNEVMEYTDWTPAEGYFHRYTCTVVGGCGVTGCTKGDMNGDGGWNVLDIVALANCVLADNCGE